MSAVRGKTDLRGFKTIPFIPSARRTAPPYRRAVIYGVCLHTSGRGVLYDAKQRGCTPLQAALDVYRRAQDGSLLGYPWGGPHYVIDTDETVVQLAEESIVTVCCGSPDRAVYLHPDMHAWKSRCSSELVHLWEQTWGVNRNPYLLFPSHDPNLDYVNIEMIPLAQPREDRTNEGIAGALLFTDGQHDVAARLVRAIADAYGIPIVAASSEGGLPRITPRLVGHEDLQPIARGDAGGGWDPGWLREKPYFDFARVREAVRRGG